MSSFGLIASRRRRDGVHVVRGGVFDGVALSADTSALADEVSVGFGARFDRRTVDCVAPCACGRSEVGRYPGCHGCGEQCLGDVSSAFIDVLHAAQMFFAPITPGVMLLPAAGRRIRPVRAPRESNT